MEGLLSETFGIMVFQENVSQAAVRLADFTHARADEARALTDSGSFDSLYPGASRAALAWAYCAWQASQRAKANRMDLFGPDKHDIPNLPPNTPLQRLRREFAVLGFLPACHP